MGTRNHGVHHHQRKTFAELPAGAVIESGDIAPPHGEPPQSHELGHPAISTFAEAVDVARKARRNERSEIRQKGIASDTPIYDTPIYYAEAGVCSRDVASDFVRILYAQGA